MKFLIALLKLGSVERMEDTCLKKFFFTHFHFDVKVNFFLLKILSAGSEPTVFHWQINGDPKTHVPCTPNSVFTMQINDQSPKNKVAKNSSSVWPQLFKRLDNAIYWIYRYICNHLCIRQHYPPFIQLGPSGLQSTFCFYLSDGYQSVLLLIIIVLI